MKSELFATGLRPARGGALRRRADARRDSIVAGRLVLGYRGRALPRGPGLRERWTPEGRRHDRGGDVSCWDIAPSVHTARGESLGSCRRLLDRGAHPREPGLDIPDLRAWPDAWASVERRLHLSGDGDDGAAQR